MATEPSDRPTGLPADPVSDAERKQWIQAAVDGQIGSERLGQEIGVSEAEARAIVDARLRALIRLVVRERRAGQG